MISGLAVIRLRDDGGLVEAVDYTPIYSAVIKVACMLVTYQSYLQREDEARELMKKMDEEHFQHCPGQGVAVHDADPTEPRCVAHAHGLDVREQDVRHAYPIQHAIRRHD